MSAHCLLLNASFEPLHIVSWQKAIQLLFQGKVEVIEESDRLVSSVRISIRIPAILRLATYVQIRKGNTFIKFSRTNVLLRDLYQCQYCGIRPSKTHLTLDHVTPVVQGGKKRWENIVTSCKKCNQKKGGRTPGQASMALIRAPQVPDWLPDPIQRHGMNNFPDSWKAYLKR